jgi:hypothetical protein
MSLPAALLIALLPARWRDRYAAGGSLVACTIVGGVVEIGLGVALGIAGFAAYRQAQYAAVRAPLGGQYPYGESMALGLTLLLGCVFATARGLLAHVYRLTPLAAGAIVRRVVPINQ